MEYTEANGKYYIGGVMRAMKTPDGWTLFERESMQSNNYLPMKGEHYDTAEQALERAEELLKAREA